MLTRMSVDAESPSVVGLNAEEVAQRVADGRTNDVPDRSSRSIREIVRANVFTRFNAIIGVLFVIVLASGRRSDGLFGLVIVANTAIGIIQELRAKQTLDALAVIGEAEADGPPGRQGTAEVAPAEIVLDDIIETRRRRQDRRRRRDRRGRPPGDRRVAAHRRGRPGAQAAGDAGDVRQLRGAGSGAYRAPRSAARRTPRSSPRRPAGSPWSTPSCAAASTRSSSSSPG